jgi:hypothetical protein
LILVERLTCADDVHRSTRDEPIVHKKQQSDSEKDGNSLCSVLCHDARISVPMKAQVMAAVWTLDSIHFNGVLLNIKSQECG